MQNRKRKGFTLIELLIVVVIIGILAAIAIPKFANTKGKAYKATMKGDLRNLATAQEGYAADNAGAYSTDLDSLNYTPTTGVTITVGYAGAEGWVAEATHVALPDAADKCEMFIQNGDTEPTGVDVATASGEPKCG
jgi:type IV pilus assembly protein PilA